jgi:hypothetical protein
MFEDDTKLSSRQHQVVPNGNAGQHVVLPWDNPRVAITGFAKWHQMLTSTTLQCPKKLP